MKNNNPRADCSGIIDELIFFGTKAELSRRFFHEGNSIMKFAIENRIVTIFNVFNGINVLSIGSIIMSDGF